MALSFHLDVHDGPLDVLLALIAKNEINIYDIPIAEITRQFLDYIHQAEEVGLTDLSDFYVEAARLIYIKSQILLPKDKIDFSEEDEDPREELVERLLEYSRLKKYSELLEENMTVGDLYIGRKPSLFTLPVQDGSLFEDSDINGLFTVFFNLLKKRPVDEKVFNIYESVTEQEKTALMLELLEKNETIRFTDLFKRDCSKLHIICAFLAVLDAVKEKLITISQDGAFSDIFISVRKPEQGDTDGVE